MLTVPGNYNAAVCWVVAAAALLHMTPMKENDIGRKSSHCWSMAAHLTGFFKTSLLILQLTSRNNFYRLFPYLPPADVGGSSHFLPHPGKRLASPQYKIIKNINLHFYG